MKYLKMAKGEIKGFIFKNASQVKNRVKSAKKEKSNKKKKSKCRLNKLTNSVSFNDAAEIKFDIGT